MTISKHETPSTSVLENKSLSTKSATPSSLVLVSAKAIPTFLVLAFVAPGAAGAEPIAMAMTIGADSKSELTKSRSSTA